MRELSAKCFLIGLILLTAAASQAQKLPKIQQVSRRAPANIKIDGRATEWNNKLEAYNKNVEFFYTISNDDKNLYLTVMVPEREVIRRILNGGLTLAVNRSGKKDDANSAGITFPVFDNANRFTPRFGGSLNTANMHGQNILTDEERANMVMVGGRVGIPLTVSQADSLMRDNNQNFPSKTPSIGVKGIKNIDSLISVYNVDGIKAAAMFDNKATYTYEMALPLKYLPAGTSGSDKLTYHLMINEILPPPPTIEVSVPNGALKAPTVSLNGPPPQAGTDFWGEYILAKKQ